MAITPKTYDEVYDIIKSRIQERFQDADFNEGSFNNIFAGAYSLAYIELQSLIMDRFGKTFFSYSNTQGMDLENLAVDHFHQGVRRPLPQNARGVLTLTRKAGETAEDVTVSVGQVFVGKNDNDEDVEFLSTEQKTILTASTTATVQVTSRLAGVGGNLAKASTWEAETIGDAFDITNTQAFIGGSDVLDDDDYRTFIRNFILSIQDGTANGLEGTARNVPGVFDARLLRKLIDVGTLKADGNLEDSPFRFKMVRPILYVASETGTVNDAVLSDVRARILEQLSVGESIEIVTAVPVVTNLNVTLTFTSNQNSLRLSQNLSSLQEGFRRSMVNLTIGEDFDRDTFITKVLTENGWTGLFTAVINSPSGDVTIAENQKLVPGTISITVT